MMVNAEEDRKDKKRQVWEYRLEGDWTVLAGKTDVDNDWLSLKAARGEDLWFHVRGMPGSHVVLRVGTDRKPEKGVLETAAAIAAYHSKGRKGGVVAVSCTKAKYVTKPPRAKPGSVQIRRESIIKVRPALPGRTFEAP